MTSRHILLIEDDIDIAGLIQLHLENMGAVVKHADDGIHGVCLAIKSEWDLVLLDLNLPSCDGIDICKEIRQSKPLTPIVIITARTGENERVLGFDSGADDYISKPFSTVEFNSRIRALFRRVDVMQETTTIQPTLNVSNIKLNVRSREVYVDGKSITLTAKEFDLLHCFVKHPNQVFKRSELLQSVWGQSYEGYLHTVNTHINRLRFKIEPDPKDPRYIKTVWGVGYKLCA